ncbi:MAG TPA: tetratricopeptide repeat protein [bacterium]|nr:tetratricopeptide repeat protein [bacterium]
MSDEKAMIVKMAFLYVQSQDWYKAIEEYKKLLALDPEDAHVHNMIGDAYAKKNDDVEALRSYIRSKELYQKLGQALKIQSIDKKIAKLDPARMETKDRHFFQAITKVNEAESLAAEGKIDEAVALYHQFIAAEPINFSYREKLANLLLEHARVSEAADALRGIAEIHLREGRLEQAQEFATRVTEMDPDGVPALRLLAILARQKGDQEGVSKYYGKLAQLAYDAGNYEEAKSAIEVAEQAGNQGLRPLSAKTLMGMKQYKEAKQQFDLLYQANPEDEVVLEQLLGLAEEMKDWPSAHKHIETLINRRPGEVKLMPRLARILLQIGKRPEALQIYLSLAGDAVKENRLEAAFNYFDNILALEPENTDVMKKKAELFLKLGKKQEVIDIYKKLQVIYTNKKLPEEAKKVALILTKLAGLK